MTRMDWKKLLTRERFGLAGSEFNELGRSGFERDLDRIIFSTAFRRLQGKTQVHPLPKNDHIHNRLTHSLEVASVGRTLGNRLGLYLKDNKLLPNGFKENDLGSIVQASCTAHDIGNPPFGHAFEASIGDWFRKNLDSNLDSSEWEKYLSEDEIFDLIHFDGNAQGFRILTCLEHHFFNGGMRLSYPVLASFLKYPWIPKSAPYEKKDKASCFLSERNHLDEICEKVGLLKIEDNRWCRHPLAHLVESADDICYRIIDIEDGIELGIINFSDYRNLLESIGEQQNIPEHLPPGKARRKFFTLRGKIFDKLIDCSIDAFKKNYEKIMSGEFEGDLIFQSKNETADLLSAASNLCRKRVFVDRKKTILEIGVYENVNITLGMFCEAVREYIDEDQNIENVSQLTSQIVTHVESEGFSMPNTLYECIRGVVDYVSGMTDGYATYVARQIGGMAD